MSKNVFVLGAGTSAHCGTPLMNNFLEVAHDLMRSGEVEEVRQDFEDVFDAIGKLQGIQSKARIDTYNIEDVYAAFEMGNLLGSLPGIDSSKIPELISSTKKVIAYTLQQTTRLPENTERNAPDSYFQFAKQINVHHSKCSIITFNYDLGLDYSLYASKVIPDYGLDDINISGRSVSYLKLHGSLNWGWCNECKKITPYRDFDSTNSVPGRNYNILPLMERFKAKAYMCSKCGKPVEETPFIVPPTWNKTSYHEQIETIWKKAASELKDAENIFVLGYSFPETDMFFRYLFALEVDMTTILKRFHVYNIDSSGNTENRFRDLLGSGVIDKFQYSKARFERASTQAFLAHPNIFK
ncbi:hypothetical protein ACFLYF_04130 [Chloroflexota bacterium]